MISKLGGFFLTHLIFYSDGLRDFKLLMGEGSFD